MERRDIDGPTRGRDRGLSRRGALAALGGLGVTAVAAACGRETLPVAGSTSTSTPTSAADATSTSVAGAPGSTRSVAAACELTPEVTEGPYFIAGDQIRRDITEGRPGAPLDLRITVVDADTCAPLRDVAVDIWHCDAGGIYSGFVQQSQAAGGVGGGPGRSGAGASTDSTRFLRGIQVTDDDGLARFTTIYPGWYRGRTVHIHVKVAAGSTQHTGQIFFDDALSDAVFTRSPYAEHGRRDQTNATDSIFAQSPGTVADVAATGDGYTGTITLAVRGAAAGAASPA